MWITRNDDLFPVKSGVDVGSCGGSENFFGRGEGLVPKCVLLFFGRKVKFTVWSVRKVFVFRQKLKHQISCGVFLKEPKCEVECFLLTKNGCSRCGTRMNDYFPRNPSKVVWYFYSPLRLFFCELPHMERLLFCFEHQRSKQRERKINGWVRTWSARHKFPWAAHRKERVRKHQRATHNKTTPTRKW